MPRSRCAHRRYWVDDGEFDPTLYGEKVRELIGEYLESLSVEQVLPRLLDRKRFPREGRGAGQPPARASEMEHAIRHHITVHLGEDPNVYGAVAARARGDAGAAYGDRPPGTAADQHERDALAAGVATAVEADLFITERPYLFGDRKIHIPCVTLCRVREALSVVGLYLRSQGEYALWRATDGSGGPRANEWLYHQIGAVALMHELWRWSRAQSAAPQQGAPDPLGGLTGALLLRVVRALRARDSFHRALNLPQQRDAVRTVLGDLDIILVTLMGAVDASPASSTSCSRFRAISVTPAGRRKAGDPGSPARASPWPISSAAAPR